MTAEILLLLLKTNLAIAATAAIVLLIRRPLRAVFGARVAYAAWLVVPLAALAVMLPARVETLPPAMAAVAAVAAVPVDAAPSAAAMSPVPTGAEAKAALRAWSGPIVFGWAAVALLCLGVQAGRQRRFVRALGRLRVEAHPDGRLHHAEHAGLGPAVVGAWSPRVVLPADFTERFTPEEQSVVVAHERAHLAAGDAQINALVAAARALFWFNPLVHVAAGAIRIDQELACDAAVLARFPRARRSYGEAMLKTQLAPLAPPLGCHWPAQGKQQLLERLRMLGRERPGRSRRLAGAGLVAALAMGAGLAAWAAQPPRPVRPPAAVASPQAARLGADLVEALIQDDIVTGRALIRAGADVNRRVLGDGTPLIIAARNGQTEMVDLLLARGADPNLGLRGDGNPLINAARTVRPAIVRTLVEHGADVNSYVFMDETPLINAARAGDLETVRYLVEHGADVTLAVPYDPLRPSARRSPLSEALRGGHAPVADFLRSRGAST